MNTSTRQLCLRTLRAPIRRDGALIYMRSRNVSTVKPPSDSIEDKLKILDYIERKGLPKDWDPSAIPFDLLGRHPSVCRKHSD